MLVLDDVQWCDDASATLLHYATRMNRHRPLLVALGARAGELLDNAPMCRTVRALRHEGLLSEIRLGPLGRADTEELVRAVAPAADGARVFGESGGNPLFAIEVARAPHRREGVSLSLGELVRERLARLPAEAAHLLRWGAVLGAAFGENQLRDLTAMEPEALVDALEQLERHALVRSADHIREAGGAYAFAHDVVRIVVYGDLSAPRRRLMHLRVAKTLNDLPDADESIAAEIAHHAALAGEAALAARACVAAGRRCLRVFANAEAESLARRGMRHAEEIRDSERVRLLLELHQISVAARRPEKLDETALRVEELAEEAAALGCREHARLGFNLVSWLRWERGEWSDAQRYTLEAERVSRSGGSMRRGRISSGPGNSPAGPATTRTSSRRWNTSSPSRSSAGAGATRRHAPPTWYASAPGCAAAARARSPPPWRRSATTPPATPPPARDSTRRWRACGSRTPSTGWR